MFLWWIHYNQYDNQCKDDEDSDTKDESQEIITHDSSSDTTEFADDISEDDSEIDQEEADSENNEKGEHPIFKKCTSFKRHAEDNSKICQTDIDASDMDSLFEQLQSLEQRNNQLLIEIKKHVTENFDLKAKNTEYIPFKGKVRQLETQNSVLKEKSIDVRKENDMLVEKIQTLQVNYDDWIVLNVHLKMPPFQKRLSCEQQVRVSVSEYETEDLCFVEKSPEIDSPGESLGPAIMRAVTPTPGSAPSRSPLPLSRASSIQEEFQRNLGFQEAAEKV